MLLCYMIYVLYDVVYIYIRIYCEFPISCISICQLPRGSCQHVSCPTFNPLGLQPSFGGHFKGPSEGFAAAGVVQEKPLAALGTDRLLEP